MKNKIYINSLIFLLLLMLAVVIFRMKNEIFFIYYFEVTFLVVVLLFYLVISRFEHLFIKMVLMNPSFGKMPNNAAREMAYNLLQLIRFLLLVTAVGTLTSFIIRVFN